MSDNRLVNGKNQVAVVYSEGFGAGWSTWNKSDCSLELCLDRQIAEAVAEGNTKRAIERGKEICEGLYEGGAESLKIFWIEKGARFKIDEYDGSESVVTDDDLWMVAS